MSTFEQRLYKALRPKRKRAKPRRSVYRNAAYRRWCTQQACVVSGWRDSDWIKIWERYAVIDPAHSGKVNGTSSKAPDYTCVPLERVLHTEYDRGRGKFEKKWGVCMADEAAKCFARWLEESGTKPPI
jgi:hypothetical protein